MNEISPESPSVTKMVKFTDCGALDVEMLAVRKFLCMMKGHKSLIKLTNRVHLSFQFQIKHSDYNTTLPSSTS